MAAPSPSAPGTPSGIMLETGQQTLITFSGMGTFYYWEVETGLMGIDGGDPINATTHRRTTWGRMAPRALKTGTPFDIKVGYDPIILSTIPAQINVERTATEQFPDGTRYAFYCFIQKFVPDPAPIDSTSIMTATMTIVPTNSDPTTGAEEGPVIQNVVGT
jgi:hypothetical protein